MASFSQRRESSSPVWLNQSRQLSRVIHSPQTGRSIAASIQQGSKKAIMQAACKAAVNVHQLRTGYFTDMLHAFIQEQFHSN